MYRFVTRVLLRNFFIEIAKTGSIIKEFVLTITGSVCYSLLIIYSIIVFWKYSHILSLDVMNESTFNILRGIVFFGLFCGSLVILIVNIISILIGYRKDKYVKDPKIIIAFISFINKIIKDIRRPDSEQEVYDKKIEKERRNKKNEEKNKLKLIQKAEKNKYTKFEILDINS
ncbi:MAG: hypothetical protein J7L15_09430 [Clostridiales bacterium]|nr:hypothetical protein [Clostridiales bacterium]